MSDPSEREVGIDCRCEGEPYDAGFAQGRDLRERIAVGLDVLPRLDSFRRMQPWWLPYPLYRAVSGRKASRFLTGGLSNGFEHHRDFLAGVAAGSGIAEPLLHLFNAMEPMLASSKETSSLPPLGACSALAVRGARTVDGAPIIARNFDYLPIVQPLLAVRESRPVGGLRSLNFFGAPLSGTVDGVNEAGLCIAYDYAFATDPASPAPTISMLIADALATCRTVTEAVELFETRPRWGAGILMLADEHGDLASLELSNTRCAVRRPVADEDHVCHSNVYRTHEVRAIELDRRSRYDERAPRVLRGRRVTESAELRNARLEELVSGTDGAFDADTLHALFSDHGSSGDAGSNTICMHGDYWVTAAFVQLFPRERRMGITYGPPCRSAPTLLSLN